jgi:hypothetical protein
MNSSKYAKYSSFKRPVSLILAGIGMRRKTFLFIEVDVYQIAINVSDAALKRAKATHGIGRIADALLAEENPAT